MATVKGLLDSAKLGSQQVIKPSILDRILQLQPDETPYFQIVARADSRRKVSDVKYGVFEDDLLPSWTTVGAVYTATDTSITLATTEFLVAGDVIKNVSTDEIMRVTGVTSSTVITVKRAWGTTAAAAGVVGQYIVKIGLSIEEGADSSRESITTQKAKRENYIQNFEYPVKISKSGAELEAYGGSMRNFERKKAAVEFKKIIESQFIHGEPKEDLTGAKPVRQTGGILYFLSTGGGTVLDMNNAALTKTSWLNWLKDVFTYSADDVYVFAGPRILSQIGGFAEAALQSTTKDERFGIRIQEYLCGFGIAKLVLSRQFIGPYAGMAVGLRPQQVNYAYLRDVALELDAQNPEAHYYLDRYIADVGLDFRLPKLGGIIKGVAEA